MGISRRIRTIAISLINAIKERLDRIDAEDDEALAQRKDREMAVVAGSEFAGLLEALQAVFPDHLEHAEPWLLAGRVGPAHEALVDERSERTQDVDSQGAIRVADGQPDALGAVVDAEEGTGRTPPPGPLPRGERGSQRAGFSKRY